jgi:hypothetical protein
MQFLRRESGPSIKSMLKAQKKATAEDAAIEVASERKPGLLAIELPEC